MNEKQTAILDFLKSPIFTPPPEMLRDKSVFYTIIGSTKQFAE